MGADTCWDIPADPDAVRVRGADLRRELRFGSTGGTLVGGGKMFWLVIAGASAAPPELPVWVPEEDGDDADDSEVLNDTVAGDGPAPDDSRVTCGLAPEARAQDWADPSQGQAALVAPDLGESEMWIVATARIGTDVVHWTQGPFSVREESVNVDVALPSRVLMNPLAAQRRGTLSVRVVAQDAEGGIVGRWALPRLAWTLQGSEDGSPVFALPSEIPVVRSPDDTVSADL
jgi:hypothetical protein